MAVLKGWGLSVIIVLCTLHYGSSQPYTIYLLPGEGSDYRIFKYLQYDTSLYQIIHVKYPIPSKHESMKGYALRLSTQFNTDEEFLLIGVSLGGMLAVELSEILNPMQTIIISSAKCRSELPWHYRFQKYVPLYRLFTGRFLKAASFVAQPLFEPDRKLEEETCKVMLQEKNPKFFKRSTKMILKWYREDAPSDIIHIHSDNDHTIPYKNVHPDYTIADGSHMMMITKPNTLNQIIQGILTRKRESI